MKGANLKREVEKLGRLTILVQRVKNHVLSPYQGPPSQTDFTAQFKSQSVPEKALKGQTTDTNTRFALLIYFLDFFSSEGHLGWANLAFPTVQHSMIAHASKRWKIRS